MSLQRRNSSFLSQRISSIALMSTMLTLGIMSFGTSVKAQESSYTQRTDCTNATIKGAYGYVDTGFRGTEAPFTPFNAVRTSVFDGNGNFQGRGYLSQGGVINQYTTTGTYKVESDCTVSITNTLTFTDGSTSQPSSQFGIIVDGGRKVLQIQLTSGRNESGYYERIRQ